MFLPRHSKDMPCWHLRHYLWCGYPISVVVRVFTMYEDS